MKNQLTRKLKVTEIHLHPIPVIYKNRTEQKKKNKNIKLYLGLFCLHHSLFTFEKQVASKQAREPQRQTYAIYGVRIIGVFVRWFNLLGLS